VQGNSAKAWEKDVGAVESPPDVGRHLSGGQDRRWRKPARCERRSGWSP